MYKRRVRSVLSGTTPGDVCWEILWRNAQDLGIRTVVLSGRGEKQRRVADDEVLAAESISNQFINRPPKEID